MRRDVSNPLNTAVLHINIRIKPFCDRLMVYMLVKPYKEATKLTTKVKVN